MTAGTAGGRGRSWRDVADALGLCVLGFAFLPALTALPAWIRLEAAHPFNLTDPIVLAFLPVRGAIGLLNGFWDGARQGVIAGAIHGALVTAWASSRRGPIGWRRCVLAGAVAGGVAALLMLAVLAAAGVVDATQLAASGAALRFEVGLGVACGAVVTAPAIARLAGAARTDRRPVRVRGQRRSASASRSQ